MATAVHQGRRTPDEAAQRANDKPITPPELAALKLIAQGYTLKGIAETQVKSEATIKTHLSRAYQKLGATGQGHAVALCYQRGLIPVPEAASPAPPVVTKAADARERMVRARRSEYITQCLRSGLAARARQQCRISVARLAALCGVVTSEVEQWEAVGVAPSDPMVVDAYYELLRELIKSSLRPDLAPILP